jgi:hypothetical protein
MWFPCFSSPGPPAPDPGAPQLIAAPTVGTPECREALRLAAIIEGLKCTLANALTNALANALQSESESDPESDPESDLDPRLWETLAKFDALACEYDTPELIVFRLHVIAMYGELCAALADPCADWRERKFRAITKGFLQVSTIGHGGRDATRP